MRTGHRCGIELLALPSFAAGALGPDRLTGSVPSPPVGAALHLMDARWGASLDPGAVVRAGIAEHGPFAR